MNPPDRTMVYRVSRNKHVMGEFDIDRIVELLDAGEFFWTDLCWTEGMGGWEPLSSLRSEIAAAKAFPAFTTAAPAAAGRRRMASPKAPSSGATRTHVAGWSWFVAGVSLGALVGLLTAQLFPEEVQVDRIVKKIVEKPVEVVRTVERRVEVPARLTGEQLEALEFAKARDDALRRDIGYGAESMVPVMDKKVRVIINCQADSEVVSEAIIRSRIEAVLRRNGYTVLGRDVKDFASTFLVADINSANAKVRDRFTGYIMLSVKQRCLVNGGGIQKLAWVTMNQYGFAISYSSQHLHQIPSHYDDLAVKATDDLLMAGPLRYSK